MSADNKYESDELLAHEKKISELYQNDKQYTTQQPSAQIDAAIMAMAKQQLADNSSLLIKEQPLNQPPPANTTTKIKNTNIWKWPFSLVASVGLLSVLMMTQKEYFIHPNDIVAEEAGNFNEPITFAADISAAEILADEIAAKQPFQSMKMTTSAQKHEVLLDKGSTAAVRTRMPVRQTPQMAENQTLDRFKLEGHVATTSSMSLLDMSKLAELLKLELEIQNISEHEASPTTVKMQQTLFENLIQYQKNQIEFTIPEKYLSVLSEKHVQQLQSVTIEAVPES